MCGIFALLGTDVEREIGDFTKGAARGPEGSRQTVVVKTTNALGTIGGIKLGFHLLSINGYRKNGSCQPIEVDGVHIVCNGEIYNWRKIYEILGTIDPQTESDSEVIIHLYKRFGIEYTLQVLDGVFAFVLVDTNKHVAYAARDAYGVRPLFWSSLRNETEENLIFASELKMMTPSSLAGEDTSLVATKDGPYQFPPGSYVEIHPKRGQVGPLWSSLEVSNPTFFARTCGTCLDLWGEGAFRFFRGADAHLFALGLIRGSLQEAVYKRVVNTDRPIACLLSGGLDSSLVAAFVAKKMNRPISTWSIGLKGSVDLQYANIVADHIGSDHHNVEVEEGEFLEAIRPVIKAIESYDTTTVRASVGNWLIAKYIREHSDAKVVFNGDGADEVCGGYLYLHCAPDSLAFDHECRRLLGEIHYFDVLRSDRCVSAHGLEARTPFLDRVFVQAYMSIPVELRYHVGRGEPEKGLLRSAFSGTGLLPESIIWRTKEAFSDGVSEKTRSWFNIIQDYARTVVKLLPSEGREPSGLDYENALYKSIFLEYYPKSIDVIPHMWMPRFVDATDASARTLSVYKRVNDSAVSC
jgi:asparagine synthase (glutamine-hydrolysing)